MSKRFLLSIHKWLGLIAGIFILIMGISGSILVFDDEIEHFIQRDVIHLEKAEGPVSLDAAYRSIVHRHGSWDVRFTHLPTGGDRAIEAEIRRPDSRRYLYLHPQTGEILRDLDSYDTFSYWMLKLHYTLHSGFFGEVLMLIFGIAFIGSLITGFWFYRKAIKRVLTFKIRPRFRNLRTGSSELHRFVGVWALVFNLITAVTGAAILYIVVSYNLQAPDEPPVPNPPVLEVSLDAALDQVRKSYLDFSPSYIRMPVQESGAITIYGRNAGDLPFHYEFSNYVQIDPKTGQESYASFIQDQPLQDHLLSVIYPLHFGDWGGIPIKIFYCLFGLAPALLSITGFIIWQQRKKRKKKLRPSSSVKHADPSKATNGKYPSSNKSILSH